MNINTEQLHYLIIPITFINLILYLIDVISLSFMLISCLFFTLILEFYIYVLSDISIIEFFKKIFKNSKINFPGRKQKKRIKRINKEDIKIKYEQEKIKKINSFFYQYTNLIIVIKVFIVVLIALILSELILICFLYFFDFEYGLNIPFLTVIGYIYLLCAIITGIGYSKIFSFDKMTDYVSINIRNGIIGSCVLSCIAHLIIYIIFLIVFDLSIPLLLIRFLGFGIEFYIYNFFINFYSYNINVDCSLTEYNVIHSNYPITKNKFKLKWNL